MANFVRNLGVALGNILFLGDIAIGAEGMKRGLEDIEEKNSKDPSFYEAIDFTKTGLGNLRLSFTTGFDVSASGNILFSDGTKMFGDDSDNISLHAFKKHTIPKVYFYHLHSKELVEIAKKASIDLNEIKPVIGRSITGLSGECENSACGSEEKIEKSQILGFGDTETGFSLDVYFDVVGEDIVTKRKTLNAHNIFAIGGNNDYAIGINSAGIVNANRLVAIGGNAQGAEGFINDYQLNVGSLVAMGGQKFNAKGLNNTSQGILKANVITAIGGGESYSYGIYNGGSIDSNFLLALGGVNVNSIGIYNARTINTDVLLALSTQNSGVGVLNEGKNAKIEVRTLIIAGSNGYHPLANYGGSLKAQDIYLLGGNTINNQESGSIITNRLFVNNFSNITGKLDFDASKASLLFFNIFGSSWENNAFLNIKNSNFILNANTNIEVNFSDEWVLGSNLAYDKIYSLLAMSGGELIDNRLDKNIKFLGALVPKTQITKNGIDISFPKDGDSNPFAPSIPAQPLAPLVSLPNKLDSLGLDEANKQNLIHQISSISSHAPAILESMLQSNAKGNSFQEVALNEGMKNFTSNPTLLKSLVQKTDEMLQQATLNTSIFSQKASEYIGQKATDRINTLMFEKVLSKASFKQLMRQYAQASNDETIYTAEQKPNTAWINIGGSYYQSSSASLSPFSVSSANVTMGYDRDVDVTKDLEAIFGGLFGYAKSFYSQEGQSQSLDIFTLGTYSNFVFKNHEIQAFVSLSNLLGDAKLGNQSLGLAQESYANNNLALNVSAYYKYKFAFSEGHFLKPLALGNYSFLYNFKNYSKTFDIKSSHDEVFALGVGGEYGFENTFMRHTFQLTGRYHIKDITKSRVIAFKAADTAIDYDLNPARMWARVAYGARFVLPKRFDLNISLSADMSEAKDFLATGNVGFSYVW